MLAGIFVAFMLHVVGIYWWFRNDDLLYPLAMLPPKSVPPFWHAVFVVLVNGMEFFLSLQVIPKDLTFKMGMELPI